MHNVLKIIQNSVEHVGNLDHEGKFPGREQLLAETTVYTLGKQVKGLKDYGCDMDLTDVDEEWHKKNEIKKNKKKNKNINKNNSKNVKKNKQKYNKDDDNVSEIDDNNSEISIEKDDESDEASGKESDKENKKRKKNKQLSNMDIDNNDNNDDDFDKKIYKNKVYLNGYKSRKDIMKIKDIKKLRELCRNNGIQSGGMYNILYYILCIIVYI